MLILGTYEWNFLKDEIEWSDEMYRIYETDRNEKLSLESILQTVHPDDRKMLEKMIQYSFAEKKPYDFYYRIVTKNNTEKILHSKASIQLNKEGKPERIVGTDQDVTEKQKLIRSLSKSESIYKQVEAIANMGNWSWDVANNKLEWTDQLYTIYGLEPQSEQITIERFLSFIHPEDRASVERGVKEFYSEETLDYTFRIITTDGTQKWLRSLAQVLRDENGNVNFIVGTEQDVTERQKLIGKLEESQRLYKQAQELAKMGNFYWNVDSNEVYWSDEVYSIYERKYGEEVNFEDAFIPIADEHKNKVRQAVQETLASKKGQPISYAIKFEDGRQKYINLYTDVLLDHDEKVTHIIGTAQDVTEKERLIQRLQESEKLYMQAQSIAQMGNWSLDLNTKETTWSDEIFRIYEIQKGKTLSIDEWKNYLEPVEADRLIAAYDEALKDRKSLDVIHKLILPNGKTKMLHRKGELVFDEDGKPIKMIGTTQDITSQFKTQAELKESQTFILKITDATPSIISSYNVNSGVYTFISEGVRKLLGYDTSEVMQKGIAFFAELVHPDDLDQAREKNIAALSAADSSKADVVTEFTYRIKHKNGSWRWLHTYGTVFDRNAEGKIEHVLNISLDITEQKEAIETIKEQEHFIQQIADASPTILYLFDVPTQSIAYINREAFFVLGYLPEEDC